MAEVTKTIKLDYEARSIIHPNYFLHKITPTETNGTITVDSSGGQTLTFNLPADHVFNPAKSYLKFNYAVSAGTANAYQYMPADCLPWWRTIDWSPSNGLPLVHVEDFDHFSKLSL